MDRVIKHPAEGMSMHSSPLGPGQLRQCITSQLSIKVLFSLSCCSRGYFAVGWYNAVAIISHHMPGLVLAIFPAFSFSNCHLPWLFYCCHLCSVCTKKCKTFWSSLKQAVNLATDQPGSSLVVLLIHQAVGLVHQSTSHDFLLAIFRS